MEFIDFKKEGVWLHFLREKCGQSAQCKLCKTILKTVGGSIKGLHKHLKRRHDINLKRKADDDGEGTSEQPTAKARKTATSGGPMTKFFCLLQFPGFPGIPGIVFKIPEFPGIKLPAREWTH